MATKALISPGHAALPSAPNNFYFGRRPINPKRSTVNNQDSVMLMKVLPLNIGQEHERDQVLLAFLIFTRIFYFQCTLPPGARVRTPSVRSSTGSDRLSEDPSARRLLQSQDPSLEDCQAQAQQLILNLLVETRFRLLHYCDMLLRYVDRGSFVFLFVNTYLRLFHKRVDPTDIAMSIVLGVDLGHEVLEFSTRIWAMSRISLHIVITLYVIYYSAFFWIQPSFLMWALLMVRTAAFILDVSLDYCADIELHVVLSGHNKSGSFLFGCIKHPTLDIEEHGYQLDPKYRVSYAGSQFAWTFDSATNGVASRMLPPSTRDQAGHWHVLNFLICIIMLATFPLTLVIIVIYLALRCCLCLKSRYGCCRNTCECCWELQEL